MLVGVKLVKNRSIFSMCICIIGGLEVVLCLSKPLIFINTFWCQVLERIYLILYSFLSIYSNIKCS